MTWAKWLVISWSIEKELRIEAQSRAAFTHENADDVRKLCASIIKQNAYQAQLIKQATAYICELELTAMINQPQPQSAHRAAMSIAHRAARYTKLLGHFVLSLLRRPNAVIPTDDLSI
jgi:hypothetical protein